MNRAAPVTQFELPATAIATGPAEARGLARDEVRLLVATPQGMTHSRFRSLPEHLNPGDLLVVNDSATIAAAVPGHRCSAGGSPVVVHFSSPAEPGRWIVELRTDRLERLHDASAGEQIGLPQGAILTLVRAWPDPAVRRGSRLWVSAIAVETDPAEYLAREAVPITYRDDVRWPLRDYQTIFAARPGSAEMVSASRPFSRRVLAALAERGVEIATLTLHTGVSSLEADELPLPERYEVKATTALAVNAARARGNRIVAAGTTATRALETVAAADGTVHAETGVTDLILGPDRGPRVVQGLITGWHEPAASHLLLLEALAGPQLVSRAYAAALHPANGGYLWHEFGDSALFLP